MRGADETREALRCRIPCRLNMVCKIKNGIDGEMHMATFPTPFENDNSLRRMWEVSMVSILLRIVNMMNGAMCTRGSIHDIS